MFGFGILIGFKLEKREIVKARSRNGLPGILAGFETRNRRRRQSEALTRDGNARLSTWRKTLQVSFSSCDDAKSCN
jgi:hypothetical protein